MTTYNSNYELAQEISARLGTEPIPFESVLSLCHEIYTELGGDEEQFDNVYEILLEILPLARQTNPIDDSVIALNKTWSSNKVNTELSGKQNTLVAGSGITISGDTISAEGKSYNAGQNISIDSANTISADGYVFDSTKGSFAEKYLQDVSDGGQILTNTASGNYGAHAEGYGTTASGSYGAHAEGEYTVASGYVSHAEGGKCVASGNFSHAEGSDTIASGVSSHAEGWGGRTAKTIAIGDGSHAEGCSTRAQNIAEHAEGIYNVSHKATNTVGNEGNTQHSVGIGLNTDAHKNAVEIMQNGDYYMYGVGGYDGVHIKGENTGITVQTVQEYVTGLETAINSKQDTLTAGQNISIDSANTISADGYVFDKTKHAFRTDADTVNGSGANVATGINSFSCGDKSTASGDYGSFAAGSETVASGWCAFAEGNQTTASGYYSHAEGWKTKATNDATHAEGYNTEANNVCGHAEGYETRANGYCSHAEGWGDYSHNSPNNAAGDGSHVEGIVTTALNKAEHAEGTCNLSHKASNEFGSSGNTLSSIGFKDNDYWTTVRKNAREIMQNADMYIYGIGNYDGVHIKGEVSGTTVQTLQEVINSKADVYETATTADIEALFA